ncbi:hypothetical protein [Natrinema salsiterrestre]|uniref:Uncharacterized protein n=1 Tax=Natrinema salsiterrestre TaxID=2950540 RepID=A0A9Q4L1D6_9EURY|nr:hypothetical protein [Natrinema salsiterrestre]MDF9744717.1 hypothetical protein [Natrinema salsiterrestre]
MATQDARSGDGFLSFFRRYTQTWVHAVAAAGLTAFGTLTIFHRWFIVLALASYVVPPIVLYVWGTPPDRTDGESAPDRSRDATTDDRPPETNAGSLEGTPTGNLSETDDTPAGSDTIPDGERTDVSPDLDDAGLIEQEPEEDRPVGWQLVDVPTEATLRDVCVTEAGAVHAVGEDGLVLTGEATGGGNGTEAWAITLEDGPAAEGEELHGVDATAEGEAIWIAGDSGAVGRLEADTGLHTDYTAPADITDNWLGVAVGGANDDETVLLINGSGAVLRGRYRDGAISWDDPVTPGSGSSLSGVALADASVGYCCDTNDGVFETTDGGTSFDRVGLEDAGGTLETLATLGRGDCLVSADDGVVHRYGGSTWTPERVGEGAICGLARREGETIACDADGVIYERTAAGDWDDVETRAPESLIAVSVDPDGNRAVAVGEDGTVVERS